MQTASHENESVMNPDLLPGKGDTAPAATKSAWPAFLAARDALIARIERKLAEAGLPELGWYDVLWALEKAPDGRLRMAELADTAVIARSNLTRLVDRLETAALVVRERVSTDRRGAYAVLTEQGRELRRRMWQVYGPAIEECFGSHLNAEESAVLRELMLRLLNAARKSD
jgi:DNA-binding MarR family transcriptional regulator